MNNEKIVMTRKANAKMAHIQVQNGGGGRVLVKSLSYTSVIPSILTTVLVS